MIGGNPSHRILVIDDETAVLRTLERILRSAGYTEVQTCSDSRRALPMFREFEPDIVLLDLRMPHLDGFAVMRQIRSRVPAEQLLPILIITGEMELEVKQRALADGATDFLTKPYDRLEAVLRVKHMLDARDLTVRLDERIRERASELNTAEMAMAERLALVAELRDYRGAAHAQRVGHMAFITAAALGLPDDETAMIRRAAPLHDIGKIGIPDAILLKPGPLTLEELDILKTHTSLGAKILAGSASPILQLGEEIALYHHENWDGTGYTPGLAGEAIPLAARITAVADVFDALVHERPFKEAWAVEDALRFIEEQKGRKFDPAVVAAFFRAQATADLPIIEDTGEWNELEQLFWKPAALAEEPPASQQDPGLGGHITPESSGPGAGPVSFPRAV